MKKINNLLLTARNRDLETKVQEANFLERLEMEERDISEIINDMKKSLGVEKNQSLIAEHEAKLQSVHNLHQSFIAVNNLTKKLSGDNLLEGDEASVLAAIERRLGEKLVAVYDLDIEDLYEVENE